MYLLLRNQPTLQIRAFYLESRFTGTSLDSSMLLHVVAGYILSLPSSFPLCDYHSSVYPSSCTQAIEYPVLTITNSSAKNTVSIGRHFAGSQIMYTFSFCRYYQTGPIYTPTASLLGEFYLYHITNIWCFHCLCTLAEVRVTGILIALQF